MFLEKRPSVIIVALLAFTHSVVGAGVCFLPNGKLDDNDVPCFSDDTKSRCCAPDEFCSTNKLCVLKTGQTRFARGSCLDKQYGKTCPDFCQGINDDGKVDLFQCGDPSLGQFCCDQGKGADCCTTPSKILTLGVGSTFPEGSLESSITMLSMSKSPVPQITSSAFVQVSSTRTSAQSVPTTSRQSISESKKESSTTQGIISAISATASASSSGISAAASRPEAGLASADRQTSIGNPVSSAPTPGSSQVQASQISPPDAITSPLSTSSLASFTSTSIFPTSTTSSELSSISSSMPVIESTSTLPIAMSAVSSSSAQSSGSTDPPQSSPQNTPILPFTANSSSQTSDGPVKSSGISNAAKIGLAVGGLVVLAGLGVIGYYIYLLRTKRRFSRRFERTLTVEKVDKSSYRGSSSSWASKVSWAGKIGFKDRMSNVSTRPMNISVPIKISNSGGAFEGQSMGQSGYRVAEAPGVSIGIVPQGIPAIYEPQQFNGYRVVEPTNMGAQGQSQMQIPAVHKPPQELGYENELPKELYGDGPAPRQARQSEAPRWL